MSRTDATTPYWVAVRHHGTEVHDHRDGTCTLWMNDVPKLPWGHAAQCRKRVRVELVCEHRGNVCLTREGCGAIAPWRDGWPVKGNWQHRYDAVVTDESVPCVCDSMPNARDQRCAYRMPAQAPGRFSGCGRACFF